jgi:hypothetical protein
MYSNGKRKLRRDSFLISTQVLFFSVQKTSHIYFIGADDILELVRFTKP